MQHVTELMELLTGKLEQVSSSDAVVGEPIELGGVTLVPLTRISLGFGGGGGEGEGQAPQAGKRKQAPSGKGIGAGSAGGAKVRPMGVAVFSDEGVEIFPIADKKGIFDKIFDKLPDVIDLVKEAQS